MIVDCLPKDSLENATYLMCRKNFDLAGQWDGCVALKKVGHIFVILNCKICSLSIIPYESVVSNFSSIEIMVHFFFYFVILHVILNVSCGLTGINLDFRLPIKLSKLDLSRNIKTSFPFEKIRYCRGGRSVSNRGVTLSGSRSLSNRYYNNIMNGIKPTNVWSKISEYSMNVYDICTFELHPVSSIVNYYNSLPVVTQSIMVLSVLSTLIFSFLTNIIKSIDINIVRNIGKEVGIDSIASLSFDMIPMEFFRILQIASTFLFFGPISMRLVYNLYFITKYASNLEYELEKRFHDKSKILTVLMSSQLIYNSLLSSFTGLTHIGQSTLSALMYAYSTITDPEEEM